MADIFAQISKDNIIKSIKAPKGVKDLNIAELTQVLENNEKMTWAEKVASVKKIERKVINKTKKEVNVEEPKVEVVEEPKVEIKTPKAKKAKSNKGKAKGKVKLKANYVAPTELNEEDFNEDS